MADSGVEGSLRVGVAWRDQRVEQVRITSSRPLLLPAIFAGKRPAEVCSTLPLLYNVCGQAQGCAAVEACEQALALGVTPRTTQLRRLLIAFETIKEHLWRVEIDWVGYLQRSVDRTPLARTMALQQRFRGALFGDGNPFAPGEPTNRENRTEALATIAELESLLAGAIYQAPPAVWLARMEAGGFSRWLAQPQSPAQWLLHKLVRQDEASLGAAELPAMERLDEAALDRRLAAADADAFIARPAWRGEVVETTPYSRRSDHPLLLQLVQTHGCGLLTRLTARLVEIALLTVEIRTALERRVAGPSGGDASRSPPAAGVGLAQVEAARVRLVHRVEMDGERVARYQILAPTEWNFHPDGVLTRGLRGMAAASETQLRARAALLVGAIDPCVGYTIVVDEPAA